MYNDMASEIAMYVAAALNHPLPPCNGRGNISTISVAQYKTKFNEIRVYCQFADESLVLDLWKLIYPEKGDSPSEDFISKCLFNDATHYRYCYLSMKKILKDQDDMVSSLVEGASYTELLFENKEKLEEYIDKSKAYLCSAWGIEDADSLRNFLFKVSGF
jgi:hypothetical protein